MSIFAHCEDTRDWHPRHPIVCMLNILGMCSAMLCVAYLHRWSLAILPIAIFVQYTASGVYHWMPYNKTRQTMDYMAIAWLIAATYIQFWLLLLPAPEATPPIYLLCGIAVMVCLYCVVFPQHGELRGVLYLVLGLSGLALSVIHPYIFTKWGWVIFSVGVSLYMLKFLVFALEKPDFWPALFGYREVQHLILLPASIIHMSFVVYTALSILKPPSG